MIIENYPISRYIELLKAQMALCSSIDENDIDLPCIPKGSNWFLCRSSQGEFLDDPDAKRPIELSPNGSIELYIRFRDNGHQIEIEKYRLAIFGIPVNNNKITSIRYDYTKNTPAERKKMGWIEAISDNPQHPMSHLHINFQEENNCRLAVGQLSPILALRAFDHWYYETFIRH